MTRTATQPPPTETAWLSQISMNRVARVAVGGVISGKSYTCARVWEMFEKRVRTATRATRCHGQERRP